MGQLYDPSPCGVAALRSKRTLPCCPGSAGPRISMPAVGVERFEKSKLIVADVSSPLKSSEEVPQPDDAIPASGRGLARYSFVGDPTLTTKVSIVEASPSETLTVIIALPAAPAAGATEIVRLPPPPPIVMP